MSRPQSPLTTNTMKMLMEGLSIKEVAFNLGVTASAIHRIVSNNPDIRKEYVTHAEFRQLLNQRKGIA